VDKNTKFSDQIVFVVLELLSIYLLNSLGDLEFSSKNALSQLKKIKQIYPTFFTGYSCYFLYCSKRSVSVFTNYFESCYSITKQTVWLSEQTNQSCLVAL